MALTPEQLAENEALRKKNEEILARHLKIGDTLTHTRCCGILEEHLYIGHDGRWICGKPTKDQVRLTKCTRHEVNDISPLSVTHLNRVPLDCLDFLAQPPAKDFPPSE
jgi:hypothetical protein